MVTKIQPPPEVPAGPLAADDVPESLRRRLEELRDKQNPGHVAPLAYGINIPKIRDYASMEQDGNPMYWDEEFAKKSKFGSLIMPWGDMISASDGPHWMPTWHKNRVIYSLGQGMAKMDVPDENVDSYYWGPFIEDGCDEIIDVGGEVYYYRPALLGDVLRRKADWIWGVRRWPRLRLGESGYEFMIGSEILNQRDEKIAFHAFRQLRYKGAPRADSASYSRKIAPSVSLAQRPASKDPFVTRSWEDIKVGEELPANEILWSWMRCLWACSSTGDYYPWHQEPEFVQQRGKRAIFIMQMAIEGIYNRLMSDWAGPETEPRHIKFDILRSICSGDTTIAGGTVTGKRVAENPVTKAAEGLVDLRLEIFNTVEDSLAGRCEATLMLPRR